MATYQLGAPSEGSAWTFFGSQSQQISVDTAADHIVIHRDWSDGRVSEERYFGEFTYSGQFDGLGRPDASGRLDSFESIINGDLWFRYGDLNVDMQLALQGPFDDWDWYHATIFGGADAMTGDRLADTLSGYGGDDTIAAGAGDDSINGNRGADSCDGGAGNDTVHGGKENDALMGGAGDDRLYGDLGDDTLTGGSGADDFHATRGMGHDVVTDFNVSEGDRIVQDVNIDDFTITQLGAGLLIDLGEGDTILLLGVRFADLPDGWGLLQT